MKPQEAVSILMLSPCYWLMRLPQRKELLQEFLASYKNLNLSEAFSAERKN